MTLRASVIVVSRNRPDALLRCLTGIEQLDHPAFEVVVVSDPRGSETLRAAGFYGRAHLVPYDEPNISGARNLGLCHAHGDVVAFIDDDAVPEPTWLRRLTEPFEEPAVEAAGGFVIGRNGISFQHRGRRVDATGAHTPLSLSGDGFEVFEGVPGRGIKTEGTNCAFRTATLRAMGGFDPAFRFFMDETDLNLRLAARGARTAIVPLAQVHHGFAASERRDATRMPRTLFDEGASQVILLRKHAPDRMEATLAAQRDEQRRRLLRGMVAGLCEPRDVARLLETLEEGAADGRRRELRDLPVIAADDGAFKRFEPRTRFAGMDTVAGRTWQAGRLRAQSGRNVAAGRRTSLYLFSPTAMYHAVRFRTDGYWEQKGGLWGRSDRSDILVRPRSFKKRLLLEQRRVYSVRVAAEPAESPADF